MTSPAKNRKTVKAQSFAAGVSFYKMAWVFVLGCVLGTWYEEILTYVTTGVYESRAGVMYGPFNPLYGTGFVIAVLLLHRLKRWFSVVLVGAIVFGAFEYGANWAQEFFTGSVSWDYSELPLNILGRTTIHYALFWGLLAFVMVKGVYPIFSRLIERFPHRIGLAVTWFFIVFLSLNMFVSYSALIRQGLRVRGVEPFTPLGEFYDDYYTDEKISELFPNMQLLPKEDEENGE